MDAIDSHAQGYFLAALLGAVVGGLVVAIATKTFPRMMRQMMMERMAQMREGGKAPSEI